jgi:hypothetical protein
MMIRRQREAGERWLREQQKRDRQRREREHRAWYREQAQLAWALQSELQALQSHLLLHRR